MLTDKCMMPYGKYGPTSQDPRKMANVPAAYLLYLKKERIASGPVLAYINDNLDVLEQEVRNESN